MRKNERIAEGMRQAADDVANAANLMLGALDQLDEWRRGAQSSPTDGGTRSTRDPDEAVLNAALSHDLIEQIDKRLQIQALKLIRLAQSTLVVVRAVRPATPVANLNDGCQHCTRLGDPHPHAGRRVGSMLVCKWVQDFHRDIGRLPNEEETHRHRDGRIVKVRVSGVSGKRAG